MESSPDEAMVLADHRLPNGRRSLRSESDDIAAVLTTCTVQAYPEVKAVEREYIADMSGLRQRARGSTCSAMSEQLLLM